MISTKSSNSALGSRDTILNDDPVIAISRVSDPSDSSSPRTRRPSGSNLDIATDNDNVQVEYDQVHPCESEIESTTQSMSNTPAPNFERDDLIDISKDQVPSYSSDEDDLDDINYGPHPLPPPPEQRPNELLKSGMTLQQRADYRKKSSNHSSDDEGPQSFAFSSQIEFVDLTSLELDAHFTDDNDLSFEWQMRRVDLAYDALEKRDQNDTMASEGNASGRNFPLIFHHLDVRYSRSP